MPELQGVTSLCVEATPTNGASISASDMPMARIIERWGARIAPSVVSQDRHFPGARPLRLLPARFVDCVAIYPARLMIYSRIDCSILRRSTVEEIEMPPTYIVPAARAVLFDDTGRILLIRRGDNHMWALPAGGMEPGESVTECMEREVWEETGLTVESSIPFAVYSEPRFTAPTRPEAQLLTVAYRVDEWSGELQRSTNETDDARWFTVEELRELPDLMPSYLETIEDCLAVGESGGFVVK